jgi:hypothetical protein
MDTTTLKNSGDNLLSRGRPKLEEGKEELERIHGRIGSFIENHPAACLAGAVALGYLVARIARHQN